MSADANKTFASIGGLLLIGGILTTAVTGKPTALIPVLFAVYMLLVATNGIRRGELHGRKNTRT